MTAVFSMTATLLLFTPMLRAQEVEPSAAVTTAEDQAKLANSWKEKFGCEDPHFFYTFPGKTLAARITSPTGSNGASAACEIDHWLNDEQVKALIDTVVAKAYREVDIDC